MKKAFFSTFLAMIILCTGCSKSKESDEEQPASAIFTGKIWSGEMTVDEHPHHEPFSFFFSSDSTVEWFHGSGQLAGKYEVKNNQITVKFQYYMWGPDFTADIHSETKLGNFVQPSGQYFKLISCELNNTTGQSLTNTTWSGMMDNKPLQFVFKANNKVQVSTNNQVYREDASYTTDFGYLAINTGADRFYGVLFGNTLKGIYKYSAYEFYPYTLTKQ